MQLILLSKIEIPPPSPLPTSNYWFRAICTEINWNCGRWNRDKFRDNFAWFETREKILKYIPDILDGNISRIENNSLPPR